MVETIDVIYNNSPPNAHALLDVGGGDLLAEADDVLGDLLDVDQVLGLLLVGADDLGAAGDLFFGVANRGRARWVSSYVECRANNSIAKEKRKENWRSGDEPTTRSSQKIERKAI